MLRDYTKKIKQKQIKNKVIKINKDALNETKRIIGTKNTNKALLYVLTNTTRKQKEKAKIEYYELSDNYTYATLHPFTFALAYAYGKELTELFLNNLLTIFNKEMKNE